MDLLVSTPLVICGEVVLRVRQNLMAKNEAARAQGAGGEEDLQVAHLI